MAAHARYPAAHEQLLILAREARAEGLSFEAFWKRAVRPGMTPVTWAKDPEKRPPHCVIWPRDTTDRGISIAATLGAKTGWKRAYNQLPPNRGEAALIRLAPELESLMEAVEERSDSELHAAA